MTKHLKLFIALLTVISNFSSSTYASSLSSPPKISLYYAQTFDRVCSSKTHYDINPLWQNELKNRISRWQNLWNIEGNTLLKTSINIVGKPYPQPIYTVALSLCSFPSMSAPIIVNSRYALHSFINKPISEDVLISTVFHEILHTYIDAFLPKETPLLNKYKNESEGVLNHLHLLALEKAVYLKLGWQTKLREVIAKDNSLPNGDYKRAWKIINEHQNYLLFINELKLTSVKTKEPFAR